MHDATSCSREDSLYQCGRPCDALSCLFFSALWLQGNQSILVLETQSAKHIDLTCFKTFPIKATICLQVGPMSLHWPVDPSARFDDSRSSLFPEVPSDKQQRAALPVSTSSRRRQNTIQAPPLVLQRSTGLDGYGPFRRSEVYYLEHQGSHWIFSLQAKEQRIKLKYLKKFFETNILCLQEVDEKDEYLQAVQVLAPRLSFFLVLSFLNTKTREDRRSAFIGTFQKRRL